MPLMRHPVLIVRRQGVFFARRGLDRPLVMPRAFVVRSRGAPSCDRPVDPMRRSSLPDAGQGALLDVDFHHDLAHVARLACMASGLMGVFGRRDRKIAGAQVDGACVIGRFVEAEIVVDVERLRFPQPV